MKTIDTIAKGKSNIENVLESQSVFLGNLVWVLTHKAKIVDVQTIIKNQSVKKSKQPVICCFYCMRKGHSVRFYKIRNFFVPKGILKWVPKNPKVPWNQINIHGPKFVRGPDLATWF